MVNKGPRESDSRNAEQRRYDAELREESPVVIWKAVPNSGGILRAVFVKDPPAHAPGRAPRPPCECNLYGSPKRKQGPHHDEDCARSKPW